MNEVVLGSEGTVLRLDAAMPPDVLRRLTYRSQRGTRTVKHVSADGKLVRSLGIQGIYRLDDSCPADLDAVLAQPAGTVSCVPCTARDATAAQAKAAADALFWKSFSAQRMR